ncbi:MAG TPA: hypothetical protein VHB73_06010 [Alphaproteobacteria bacterium]|nr:hypothetical protein [Alphaproteobacteria bacterium]
MKEPLLFILLLLVPFVVALMALPAHAGLAEAKELARNYDCQVTNLKLISQQTGADGRALYQADCALPANATEDQKKANNKLTIGCQGALCTLIKKGE